MYLLVLTRVVFSSVVVVGTVLRVASASAELAHKAEGMLMDFI